jgi:hypothetical protein
MPAREITTGKNNPGKGIPLKGLSIIIKKETDHDHQSPFYIHIPAGAL